MAHAVNRKAPGAGVPGVVSGAVDGGPAGGAEVVSGGSGDDAEGSGEGGAGEDEGVASGAVTDALGAAVREAGGDALTAGPEPVARDGGEGVAAVVYERDGMTVRPGAGVSSGLLVPWPFDPPGVVAMTAGACDRWAVFAYLIPAAVSASAVITR